MRTHTHTPKDVLQPQSPNNAIQASFEVLNRVVCDIVALSFNPEGHSCLKPGLIQHHFIIPYSIVEHSVIPTNPNGPENSIKAGPPTFQF